MSPERSVTYVSGTDIRNVVGPNGLEPSTSSVSRKRSNQTELRAYRQTVVISILMAAADSGNVGRSSCSELPVYRDHVTIAGSVERLTMLKSYNLSE